jgi:hypothetical protein
VALKLCEGRTLQGRLCSNPVAADKRTCGRCMGEREPAGGRTTSRTDAPGPAVAAADPIDQGYDPDEFARWRTENSGTLADYLAQR